MIRRSKFALGDIEEAIGFRDPLARIRRKLDDCNIVRIITDYDPQAAQRDPG